MKSLNSIQNILDRNNLDEIISFVTENLSDLFNKMNSNKSLDVLSQHQLFKDTNFVEKITTLFYDQNKFEEIYLLISFVQIEKMSIKTIRHYLKATWKLGQINDFYINSKRICNFLIQNKYYASHNEFINEFNDKLESKPFFYLSKTLNYVETCNVEKLSETLDQIELNEDRDAEKIINILKLDTNRIGIIYFEILKLENHLQKITNKKIIELLIFSDSTDVLIKMSNLLEDKDLDLVYNILVNRSVGLKKIPHKFKKLRKLYTENVSVAEVREGERPLKENLEIKYEQESVNIHYKKKLEPELKITEIENRLIRAQNYLKYTQEELHELTISFISMDLLFIAKNLAQKIEDKAMNLYYMTEISNRMNLHSETLYYANESLNTLTLKEDQKINFLYLKLQALNGLGFKNEASDCYQEICSINPSFRSLRLD